MAQLDSDLTIQQAVLRELWWDPQIGGTKIGVAVEQGVVTLLGLVDSFAESWFAQEAAHSIPGVLAVANELRVRTGAEWLSSNAEIAMAARRALELSLPDSGERLRITVSEGQVTLEGEVDSLRECEEVEEAVRQVRGVSGVKNKIAITLSAAPYRRPKGGVPLEQ